MAVEMTTPMSEIDAILVQEANNVKQEIVKTLSFLGEKCVIEARDRSETESWFDHTGNLRSSIGYVVVNDGKILSMSNFGQVKDGADGAIVGKALALKLAREVKQKYGLIVVAGMEYAEYVESLDNKVVLASAELLADQQLPILMGQLERKLSKTV